MTLLSKHLLIMVRETVSRSSQSLMLPAHMAGKVGVPAVIWAAVGASSFGTVPFTIFHNFSAFNINVSL
jgi:hypothetical protein